MRAMRTLLLILTAAALAAGCKPPPLEYTKGHVLFAKSREAFYDADWQKTASARQSKICAGFVHNKQFGHYLKYGSFRLAMAMQVFMGGSAVVAGGRVTGWKDGTLLRTIHRKIRVGKRHNSYVWCGRLQKGGTWKVGAMRFVFVLQGTERAMSEKLASGVLRVDP
jgi:hypothetical protein